MSKVQLTTLSPVHIGSGNVLQQNTEFVQTQTSTERFLRVVDDRKVLSLIGEDHLADWLLSIERKESIKVLVRRYAPQSKVTDYSKRRMYLCSDVKDTDTLKEHIHNGFGVPYIPGSSIKGSIRTAVLASMTEEMKGLSDKIKNGKGKISAEQVEKELFGKDPNSDVFRFFHAGDAYFEKDTEIALRLVMRLNITGSEKTLLPPQQESKPQLVEAIGSEAEAVFQLKLMLPFRLVSSLGGLFQLVNGHTRKLIEEEVRIWQKYKDRAGSDDYMEKMNDILSIVKSCQADECVLRIGHASGWRFITGAWTEDLPNFETDIVNAARPKNVLYYSNYDFPKSRRTDSDGDLLGFVKLKILHDEQN